MPWDKDSEETFPTKHPREPGGLRQDILDEIADHLVCATEREQQRDESGDEETVWRRVLEKFGDPDSVARRLWWDQMRETVMREWIQTGVLAVLAVAGVAGVALLIMMMGRVGMTNQAMEATMKQVAASNEALTQALAAQRADNTALLNALSGLPAGESGVAGAELYTVDVVLRRGTADGPPASEVVVTFEGKGPGDQELTLKPELDDEGRAVFERLNQGTYTLTFYDPQSQLHARERITLFAGQGAGERVYVVPDLHPRPIHIAWDLPDYGRDDDLLVSAALTGTWSDGTLRWGAESSVASGHGGTWVLGEGGAPLFRTQQAGRVDFADFGERAPCLLAGDISIQRTVRLNRRSEGSRRADENFILNPSPEEKELGRYTTEMTLLESNAEDVFPVTAPEDLLQKYDRYARNFINIANVPDSEYEWWLNRAADVLRDEIVVAAGGAHQNRPALWRDGKCYLPEEGYTASLVSVTGDGGSIQPHVRLLGVPRRSEVQSLAGNYVALPVSQFGKWRVLDQAPEKTPPGNRPRATRSGENTERIEDTAGNGLGAYFIRSPWRDSELVAYGADEGGGLALKLDETPFWQMPTEMVQLAVDKEDVLFIPLPESAFDEGDPPVTGVLVRFEEASEEFGWGLTLREGDDVSDSPIWLGTQSIVAWEGPNPLSDTEGRFHYDKLEDREILQPRIDQPLNMTPVPKVAE